jgi:hypothetical protein
MEKEGKEIEKKGENCRERKREGDGERAENIEKEGERDGERDGERWRRREEIWRKRGKEMDQHVERKGNRRERLRS